MIQRILLALALALSLSVPAKAQSIADAPTLEGFWTFSVEGTSILAFTLKKEDGEWKGRWIRPRSFSSDGVQFVKLVGPPVVVDASKAKMVGGWLELTFDDPRPGAVPDIFRLRVTGKDEAEAIYTGTGFPVLKLARAEPTDMLGPWPPGEVYRRKDAGLSLPGSLVQFSIAPELIPTPGAGPEEGPPAEPVVRGR